MWRYTPVANVCLELLLSCLLGAAMAALGVVTPRARNALSAFVFNVALPLLVTPLLSVAPLYLVSLLLVALLLVASSLLLLVACR